MIMCDRVFTHGGINKSYGSIIKVPAVTCKSNGKEMSWRMETMGATILHEYTHFQKLMVPRALRQETDDIEYGPYKAQHMDKKEALKNADSYNWFASENYWTITCNTRYHSASRPKDGEDPNCSNRACEAWKGLRFRLGHARS